MTGKSTAASAAARRRTLLLGGGVQVGLAQDLLPSPL